MEQVARPESVVVRVEDGPVISPPASVGRFAPFDGTIGNGGWQGWMIEVGAE